VPSLERVVFRFRPDAPGVCCGTLASWRAIHSHSLEVKTPGSKGVTVGGRKLSDQEQILNLAESLEITS